MHPSVRVLALLMFAVMVYGLQRHALVIALALMLVILLRMDLIANQIKKTGAVSFAAFTEFLRLLKRVRYILLFLLIVYAYNTPGEYVAGWYFSTAPSYEGVHAGVEQMLRLAAILAGLALLLATTGREQLIAGLYWLARPFRFAGLDPERFAVRLWLTLYYVEHGMKSRQHNSIHQLMKLEEVLDVDYGAPEQIEIMKPAMHYRDGMVLFCLVLLGAVLLCV
jgi:energy-coupling factor transport system permease protein